jgi:hypothetical protein
VPSGELSVASTVSKQLKGNIAQQDLEFARMASLAHCWQADCRSPPSHLCKPRKAIELLIGWLFFFEPIAFGARGQSKPKFNA